MIMKKFVTPIKKPLLTEKSIKVGKKALLVTSVLAVALLCSG